MLTASDLIHLPYTRDLTEGGIAYALRSLPYTYNRMGGSPYDRLRRIVAGVAVELAFRRYLGEGNIPFDVQGSTPFTDPDHYDVSLGGHRCDIKSYLITYRDQISDMRRNPDILLNAPALVPSDQHAAESHTSHDIYLFAFLAGLTAASRTDLKAVIKNDQPFYLMHAIPDAWCKPQTWSPLGALALKSESDAAQIVEINGQDKDREFLTRRIELPARTRVVIQDEFHSVSSLHIQNMPDARIGIHIPIHKKTYLIQPMEWRNVWVYGMDIWLAGYIEREEFSRRASFVHSGTRVFQYNHTKTKNLAVPISDLRSLKDLFERVKDWDKNK
ncbi:MAG: hypothetical protein MUO77_21620 [Anaerolineales bacterium]|nr:hypothetical protein [Anaerolineales bacterium]